jgi:hypothetical protein
VRTTVRSALAVVIVVTLGGSPASAGRARLTIDRDGNSTNPVKVIQRIVVRIFDELGIPRP